MKTLLFISLFAVSPLYAADFDVTITVTFNQQQYSALTNRLAEVQQARADKFADDLAAWVTENIKRQSIGLPPMPAPPAPAVFTLEKLCRQTLLDFAKDTDDTAERKLSDKLKSKIDAMTPSERRALRQQILQ